VEGPPKEGAQSGNEQESGGGIDQKRTFSGTGGHIGRVQSVLMFLPQHGGAIFFLLFGGGGPPFPVT
jgi:hypothetical protein